MNLEKRVSCLEAAIGITDDAQETEKVQRLLIALGAPEDVVVPSDWTVRQIIEAATGTALRPRAA